MSNGAPTLPPAPGQPAGSGLPDRPAARRGSRWPVLAVLVGALVVGGVLYLALLGIPSHAVQVDVTAIDYEFTGAPCSGWVNETSTGVTVSPGTDLRTEVTLANTGSTDSCTASSASTPTSGFSVLSSNAPETVAAGGTKTLDLVLETPSSGYTGLLVVEIRVTTSPPPVDLGLATLSGSSGAGGGPPLVYYVGVSLSPSSAISTSDVGLEVTNSTSTAQKLAATVAGGDCTVGSAYTPGTTCTSPSPAGTYYIVLTNSTGEIASTYTSSGWSQTVTLTGADYILSVISSVAYDGAGYTLTAYGTGSTSVSGSTTL